MITVWISGASTGIGRALAKELIINGYFVWATSRSEEKLNLLSEEVVSDNLNTAICDVSDYSSVTRFFNEKLLSVSPDVLVNCAGVTVFKDANSTKIEEIDSIIKTNLLGSVYAIQTILKGMIERKSGIILNISSVAAQKVLKGSSIYSASKAGLLQYSRVLREELRDKNIRVIDILPGATETPIWHEKVIAKYGEKMMQPQAIAKLILSLLSEASNMVSEEIVLRPVTGDL